jgi:dehydrogenase/reductase SDR family protein 1
MLTLSNCAYGIGKAGVDRISTDCGVELRKHNVACLSLMLNGVKTEDTMQMIKEKGDKVFIPLNPNDPILNVRLPLFYFLLF